MNVRTSAIALAIGASLIASAGWGAPHYRVIDVSAGGVVAGLNSDGTVLGKDAAGQIFVYEHGRKTELNLTLTPRSIQQCHFTPIISSPAAINDRGDIVIDFTLPNDTCSIVFHDGRQIVVGEEQAGAALAVNDRDQVIGDMQGFASVQAGFGANCPTQPGDLYQAFGINAGGDVVGSLTPLSTLSPVAAVCHDGKWIELGGFGGTGSMAMAINDREFIVGSATTSTGDQHAFLYKHGALIDLGTLTNQPGSTSEAFGINDEGEIIGIARNDIHHAQQPFVSVHHRLFALQDSIDPRDSHFGRVTFVLNNIFYINDRGEIAITGVDSHTGAGHIYLLQRTLEREDERYERDE